MGNNAAAAQHKQENDKDDDNDNDLATAASINFCPEAQCSSAFPTPLPSQQKQQQYAYDDDNNNSIKESKIEFEKHISIHQQIARAHEFYMSTMKQTKHLSAAQNNIDIPPLMMIEEFFKYGNNRTSDMNSFYTMYNLYSLSTQKSMVASSKNKSEALSGVNLPKDLNDMIYSYHDPFFTNVVQNPQQMILRLASHQNVYDTKHYISAWKADKIDNQSGFQAIFPVNTIFLWEIQDSQLVFYVFGGRFNVQVDNTTNDFLLEYRPYPGLVWPGNSKDPLVQQSFIRSVCLALLFQLSAPNQICETYNPQQTLTMILPMLEAQVIKELQRLPPGFHLKHIVSCYKYLSEDDMTTIVQRVQFGLFFKICRIDCKRYKSNVNDTDFDRRDELVKHVRWAVKVNWQQHPQLKFINIVDIQMIKPLYFFDIIDND